MLAQASQLAVDGRCSNSLELQEVVESLEVCSNAFVHTYNVQGTRLNLNSPWSSDAMSSAALKHRYANWRSRVPARMACEVLILVGPSLE